MSFLDRIWRFGRGGGRNCRCAVNVLIHLLRPGLRRYIYRKLSRVPEGFESVESGHRFLRTYEYGIEYRRKLLHIFLGRRNDFRESHEIIFIERYDLRTVR